jgi:FMN phosphatase YigB (HAD superfamily)
MIKAVFFDWVDTLAHPEPDRHEVLHRVAQEMRVKISLKSGKIALNCQAKKLG